MGGPGGDPPLRLSGSACEDNGVAERRKPSARDLVLSLLVISIPVIAIIWLQDSGQPTKPDVKTVSWHPKAEKARRQASYPVLAPSKLPDGWRATRAGWTRVGQQDSTGDRSVRNQWRLGLLTDDDIYIELAQGDKRPKAMINSATRHGGADGTVTVDGRRWRRLVTDDDRTRALVRTTSEVTTVVTGDTSYAKLRSFAESLHTDRQR